MEYSINNLLGASFECSCGKTHSTAFSNFVIKNGAINELPKMLSELGKTKPYIISDTNTENAAGKKVKAVLTEAGIAYTDIVLKSPEIGDLPADEKAFGSVCMAFDLSCDIIISVGTGTINDMGRYLSFITGYNFMLVATAPSMDGMVSGVAPLIHNNMKITFPAHAPVALCCDLDVMTKAPMKMILAGATDILGKYNCLTDWKLSHLVNDEYYCETVDSIMSQAIDKTAECMPKLGSRNPEDIAALAEALTLSGMAMDFAGNSRPASGAEHHLSHYWEMQFLFDGKPAVLHGTKVGIGTVMTLRLYNELAKMEKPDFDKLISEIPNRMSFEDWEAEMKRCYREGADAIIALEKKSKKNCPLLLEKRLRSIEANWDKITELAKTVPSSEKLQAELKKLGAATVPADVEIAPQYVKDGIMYAKELRDRYTILQFLWDIDKLSDASDFLMKEYVNE